jgi:WASH complex subunit 7
MIAQNQTIGNSLTLYKRMISKVMDDPELYGTEANKAGKIQYLLQKIEGDILEQNIFVGCISRTFDDNVNKIEVQTNQVFQNEFKFNLRNYFDTIIQLIDKSDECGKRYKLVGFTGLYALYERLFREEDNKYFWQIWTAAKKIPLIHIFGNTTFSFLEFLGNTTYFKGMLKYNSIKNPMKDSVDSKNAMLKLLDDSLPKKVKYYYSQICQWESRIESTFSIGEEGRDVLGIEGTLMMEGIFMAYNLSDLLKSITYLHIDRDKALSIEDIINLCKSIEMLKSIEGTFFRKSGSIAQLLSFVTELLSYKIQKLLMPIKAKIESKKKYTPQEYDQLTAIILTLDLVSNPPSKKRILLLRLTLPVALSQSTSFLKDTSYDEIKSLVSKLEMLADFENLLKNATDCSFVYWSREIFEIYFKHIFKHPTRSQELCHVFSALEDCKSILKNAKHLQNDELFLHYKKYINQTVEECISNPLCEDIEEELRLLIHTTVLGTEKEPMKITKDLTSFFKIRPILFLESYIDFEKIVEFYLNKIFYDLTAITNSDWKSYEQMRNLAHSKFGLKLSNVYLPSQTLEQGLDILLITKNIHIFVNQYSYNLNSNGFVERGAFTDTKNLNTINISHVSNSIRTHGTGIMNTTGKIHF